MIRLLLAALAALMPAICAAQVAPQGRRPDANPAVWAVRDADTTIYLFGTFHLLDGKSEWFNDEVKTAFDASDEVELEAIVPDDQTALAPLVQKYAVDPKRTLSQRLKPATWRALGEQLHQPPAAIDHFEPWFIAMMLGNQAAESIGLSSENGAEATIVGAARAAGKPIGELEGVEAQLRILDGMPEPMQVAFLEASLTDAEKIGELFPKMLAAWSAGDSDGLAALLNDGVDELPGLYKLLLSDRNARWADWIAARMKRPGTVFIAVGAGHLAGKDSVQAMLAKRGLRAERVE